MMDMQQARLNMIERQLKPWNVHDRTVLELFAEVHREDFIPEDSKYLALADIPITLAKEQVTMSPKIEARILQALEIKSADNILEVGTGCAYLTALLAKLGAHVLSIDIHDEFLSQAHAKLKQYTLNNVTLKSGDAVHGWQQAAPYDVIVLTGSVPFLEDTLKEQLTLNGRLFLISGTAPVMNARVVKRIAENNWHDDVLFETYIPALQGITLVESFKF